MQEGELPAGAEYPARLPGTHLVVLLIFALVSLIALR
jgi:hypothetical protein